MSAYSSDSPILDGVKLLKSESYDEAKIVFEKLVKRNPENQTYQFFLGNTLYLLGDYAGALKYLQKLTIDANEFKIPSEIMIIKSLRQLGDTKNARVKATALLNKGLSSKYEKMIAEEIQEIENLEKDFYQQGLHAYQAGDFSSAQDFFNQSLETKESPEARLMLAICFLQQGAIEMARENFNIVAKDSSALHYQSEARDFLEQIERGSWKQSTSPLRVVADLGAGYISNAFEEGSSAAKTSKPFGRGGLNLDYFYFSNENMALSLQYDFLIDCFALNSSCYAALNAIAHTSYFRIFPWSFFVKPQLEHFGLITGSLLSFFKTILGIGYLVGQNELGLTSNIRYGTPHRVRFDYATGLTHTESIYWSRNSGSIQTQLGYSFTQSHTKDISDVTLVPTKFQGHGVYFSASLPVRKTFLAKGQLVYQYRDYQGVVNRAEHRVHIDFDFTWIFDYRFSFLFELTSHDQ